MIEFTTVRYKNFLSTGNHFTKIDLNKNPTTLVVGENGAGKTTFLDAITFALFGKPFRNINKPQLINSINNKECLVEIEFKIGNKNYLVKRGIKPAIFEIYCENELLNQDAKSKDYQEHLENNILKMNYKSFTQIVILGSTNFKPFMQLSASERRQVIEDLLDIQIFSAMNSVAKSRLSSIKEEASKLKIQIDSTREKIQMHLKHLEELKRNSREIIDSKRFEIEKSNAVLGNNNQQIQEIQTKIDELIASIVDEEQTNKKFTKLNAFEVKIETNISKLDKEIHFFKENSTCPTCEQTITNKEDKVHECESKKAELFVGLQKLKEENNAVLLRITRIKSIQKEINSLEQNLAGLNTSNRQTRKYIEKLDAEIESLTNKPPTSEEFNNQSKQLVEDLQSFTDRRTEVAELNKQYDLIIQLLKDGGIKSKIIKQYVPVINKLVNKYLTAMDFFVNFQIDEEFKETIKSRHRDEFTYESFSEGEKKRIDLALLFTWRAVAKLKNSANTNLLIFDEVFDGALDSNGTEEFMKLINMLNDNSNVFVITHKTDQMVDKFKHILKFAKVKNFSRLV
jgi:DNA repair exonuclease SbcCD ATPase subunit